MINRRNGKIKKRIRKKSWEENILGAFKVAWKFSPYIVGAAVAAKLLLPTDLGNVHETQMESILKDPNYTIVSYQHPEENTKKNRKILAQALCGEGRIEFTNDYLLGAAVTMINRAKDSGIEKALMKDLQFSTFNKWDPNHKKIMNPEKYLESGIWRECQYFAEKILRGYQIKVKRELASATNYFVSKGDPKIHTNFKDAKNNNIPGWAYAKNRNLTDWYLKSEKERKEKSDTFILNGKKNRIPLDYLKKVDINLKDKGENLYAFFYELPIAITPKTMYLASR